MAHRKGYQENRTLVEAARTMLHAKGLPEKLWAEARILQERGILHRISMPYTPEQNGASEQENRTLVEAARTMLHAKGLPEKLWAEAAFGCDCFVHVPKQKRKKFDKKAVKGKLVGYCGDKDGFRIWIPETNEVIIKTNEVIISRDVIFPELATSTEEFPCATPIVFLQGSGSNEESAYSVGAITEYSGTLSKVNEEQENNLNEEQENNEDTSQNVDLSETETLRRSKREAKPKKFDDHVTYMCTISEVNEEKEPLSVAEALSQPDKDNWQKAMEEEMESFKENEAWELVNRPNNGTIVQSHRKQNHAKQNHASSTGRSFTTRRAREQSKEVLPPEEPESKASTDEVEKYNKELKSYKELDSLAQFIIGASVKADPKQHILTCKSSKEMWDMLHSIYEQKSERRNKENKAKVNAKNEFGQAFVSVNGGNDEKDCWLIDSGASHHICSNRECFSTYSKFEVPKALRLGDGGCMHAEGQGQVNMEMLINDVWQPGHLTNVWYVPNSKQNLFSAGAALDKGLLEYSNHKVCEFKRKDNTVVAVGVRQVSGTYKLLARVVMPDRICLAVESNNLQAWHEKLAHQNKRHIHNLLSG
ncbi:hypothetical protein QE152_g39194 [Popillia japonica]|uniref:Retrovirus-related Pol polyprotein from transposon TNT 1-94 n=1 Tax=Popillia japonica TaxID=7064 RepID=A0AAW1HVA2_POPJA